MVLHFIFELEKAVISKAELSYLAVPSILRIYLGLLGRQTYALNAIYGMHMQIINNKN